MSRLPPQVSFPFLGFHFFPCLSAVYFYLLPCHQAPNSLKVICIPNLISFMSNAVAFPFLLFLKSKDSMCKSFLKVQTVSKGYINPYIFLLRWCSAPSPQATTLPSFVYVLPKSTCECPRCVVRVTFIGPVSSHVCHTTNLVSWCFSRSEGLGRPASSLSGPFP